MPILRTRFAKEIVCEFLPPKNMRSRKVLVLCHGMPSIPKKNAILEFFSEQGYWVFFPRYRGTWESGGKFLAQSPQKDIQDVISGISKGFSDLWSGKNYTLSPSTIHLLGSSFGGAGVLLSSQDKRVDKVIALSPVIDWRVDSVTEPLDWLGEFIQQAFGDAYRCTKSDWKKLGTDDFYNPVSAMRRIDGNKVFIIHAQDDDIVPIEPARYFCTQTGATLLEKKTGGHYSTSVLLKDARLRNKVLLFLQK